ncbi:MAG: hypothetical protein KDM63_05050 [Verrucomicrobiae bacterium]|nr:hypothetical protein [Verrucomicrobiae bacterium]
MSSILQRFTFQCVLLLSLTILIAGCKEDTPPGRAWVDLRIKADELARGGEIDRAILVAHNAIEQAEADPATATIEMVWLLDDLVGYLEKADRDAETLPHRERALAKLIEAAGPDSLKLFPRHSDLASRQILVPDFVKSEMHFQRAIALAEAEVGSDAPILVDLLCRYADCLMTQRKDAEAAPLLHRARGIAEAHPGVGLEDFPDALLAALHQSQGRDGEAEEVLLRQVTQAEQDPTKPAVLEYWIGELARFYLEHDRTADAAPLWRRLVDLKQPRLGPEHPEIKALVAKLEEVSPNSVPSVEPAVPSSGLPGLEAAGPPSLPVGPQPLTPVSAEFPGDPALVPGIPSSLPPDSPELETASPPGSPNDPSPLPAGATESPSDPVPNPGDPSPLPPDPSVSPGPPKAP